MSEKTASAISTISIFLLFFTVTSKAQNNSNPICPQSSCGHIRNISYPFSLRGDPKSCRYKSVFELECQNNRTLVLNSRPGHYFVQEINYDNFSIRLVDPNINRANLSSCPLYSYRDTVESATWFGTPYGILYGLDVVFIQCLKPVSSSKYVEAPLCTGNTSSSINIFFNSSEIYCYVIVVDDDSRLDMSDVEEFCAVNMVVPASTRAPMKDISSWAGIHDVLGYGFELMWYSVPCLKCERGNGVCRMKENRFSCNPSGCWPKSEGSEFSFKCLLLLLIYGTTECLIFYYNFYYNP